MNIEIQANGIPVHRDVQHFIRCRADLALKALRDHIGLVSVFVDDIGAEDGGEDIRCLVLISLGTHPDIVVESRDENLYIAIHRAVDDAGWTLAQSLGRQQTDLLQQQCELLVAQHAGSTAGVLADAGRAA